MRLSVLDLVPVLQGADASEALRQAVLLAQAAERLGYHRYWAAEHHDMPGLACTAPEVLLAHIGAVTGRIRLGSGAVLLPHYRPIKVAETFHLLSALNPGRVDLGIGRAPGGSAHVTMALSGNFLENVSRLPESLKALADLLSGEYRVEGELVHARPIPPEAPEVWILGTNNKSASYAAEFGTGYVFGQFMSDREAGELLAAYRQDFRPSRLGAEPRAIVAIGVICADTEEEAARLTEAGAAWFRPEGEKGRIGLRRSGS
ncbi:MsnO8 family LLM class oxidoreductase [Paenibacillus sp. P25]|nr:MsnO8 family LLM class oxidoreductase [Paenibacillus sp. P25]